MIRIALVAYPGTPKCGKFRASIQGRVKCEKDAAHSDAEHAGRGKRGQWYFWPAAQEGSE